jgi:hypothetical protein
MSVKATYHTKHLPDQGIELPSTTRFILMMIADFANEEGEAWPNYSSLEYYTGFGRRSIIRAINDLVDRGLLEKVKRHRPDGWQTSNMYRLTFIPAESLQETVRKRKGKSRGATESLPSTTNETGECHTDTPGVTLSHQEVTQWHPRTVIEQTDNNHQPPTQSPANLTITQPPGMTTKGILDGEAELQHALQAAERRRATRHSASILAQQHHRVWHAFSDLQAIYTWKPAQFASIAEQILNLTREHTDHRTETAIRTVIEQGATINHPLAYIRKLLTTNDTQTGTTTPRRSLRDGLTPLDSFTLD